jgi:hypothetical protein
MIRQHCYILTLVRRAAPRLAARVPFLQVYVRARDKQPRLWIPALIGSTGDGGVVTGEAIYFRVLWSEPL